MYVCCLKKISINHQQYKQQISQIKIHIYGKTSLLDGLFFNQDVQDNEDLFAIPESTMFYATSKYLAPTTRRALQIAK